MSRGRVEESSTGEASAEVGAGSSRQRRGGTRGVGSPVVSGSWRERVERQEKNRMIHVPREPDPHSHFKTVLVGVLSLSPL